MERKKISENDGIHKGWYIEAKSQTTKTLPAFVKKLTEEYQHDYGTICHAIAAAAIGAAHAVEASPQGGITGYQASAVMWEMIRAWGVFGSGPMRMQCFEDMLYPQYREKFTSIKRSVFEHLKEKARENLEKTPTAHPDVVAHWRFVADGNVPFGFQIVE